MTSLGEIVKILKGRKAPEVMTKPQTGAYPYIQIEDLRPDAKPRYAIDKDGTIAKKTDVLIAWDGANAGTVSFELEGLVGSTIAILRPLTDDIHAPFLGYFLRSKFEEIQSNTTGATIPHVNRDHLENLRILLPPLPEQQRIAAILQKADRLCRLRRYARRLSDTYPQSVFLEMFGDPTTNPLKYPLVEFQEICESRLGKMLDAKQQTGKHLRPYLRNENIRWMQIDLNDVHEMDFDNSDREMFRLQMGDILICEGGEVGRCAIWENQLSECYFQKALHRVKPNLEKVLSEFIVWLLWCLAKFGGLGDFTSQVTIAHLTGEKLKTVIFPLPPINKQHEFANIVQKYKQVQIRQDESSRQAEHLFQSLLQRAFVEEI